MELLPYPADDETRSLAYKEEKELGRSFPVKSQRDWNYRLLYQV